MARVQRWKWGTSEKGVAEITLVSWRYVHDFVYQEMLDYTQYVWRGQRNENWPLEPSLDRQLKKISVQNRESVILRHLENFQYAVRGRRGPTPPKLTDENEWWALGQHNGLASPLLDWTHSPFVALYFAFYDSGAPQTPHRALYAMSRTSTSRKSAKIKKLFTGTGRPPICEFIRPLTDENPRLINQGGLFSRTPTGVPVESWVKANYDDKTDKGLPLLKLLIPNQEREECLRTLNKMNINHLTLFPDVFGASKYSNVHLAIPRY